MRVRMTDMLRVWMACGTLDGMGKRSLRNLPVRRMSLFSGLGPEPRDIERGTGTCSEQSPERNTLEVNC